MKMTNRLLVAVILYLLQAARWSIVGGLASPLPYRGYRPRSSGIFQNKMHCNKEKPEYACNFGLNATIAGLPFCNKALTIRARVADLLGRLTLTEKLNQLVDAAPAIWRLGIPQYEWWQEALHGVGDSPGMACWGEDTRATIFPQVILTAASFNASLWHNIAKVISTEARALYNLGRSGLTFWSPNINIFRDPRWGRGQETPGEDPLVASIYAKNFVKGLQGEELQDSVYNPQSTRGPGSLATWGSVAGPNYLKASACCKHFTAYDLDNWTTVDRFNFNAEVSEQDLEETYQIPFKSCVQEGHASCLMCSYNEINGIPSCANYDLLTSTAISEWGLNGYIVSDCDAVALVHETYSWASTPEDAVAASLKAGLDLNCGTYIPLHGNSSVSEGKLNVSTIDRALGNLFATRMRLGLFDGDPKTLMYGDLGPVSICTPEHQELADEAARQGIVLLKNQDSLLPLSASNLSSLAVIGPHGDATGAMLGNYAGYPCQLISPREGLANYTHVVLEEGCSDVACQNNSGIQQAAATAASHDVAVVIVGLDQEQESEGLDRTSLLLPGYQQQLVQEVAAAVSNASKKMVLVIMCGGPVDISFAKEDDRIGSILWAGYPGQLGGRALAEIIFGVHSPTGRLPMTWYPQELAAKVPMTDMAMRADSDREYPGRTYRFYTGRTVYTFGYGLGYSSSIFSANFSTIIPTEVAVQGSARNGTLACSLLVMDPSVLVGVRVTNQGKKRGSYTILLFVRPPLGSGGSPLRRLVAFERVLVDAGQTVEQVFQIQPCMHLSTVTVEGEKVLNTGLHELLVEESVHAVHVRFW